MDRRHNRKQIRANVAGENNRQVRARWEPYQEDMSRALVPAQRGARYNSDPQVYRGGRYMDEPPKVQEPSSHNSSRTNWSGDRDYFEEGPDDDSFLESQSMTADDQPKKGKTLLPFSKPVDIKDDWLRSTSSSGRRPDSSSGKGKISLSRASSPMVTPKFDDPELAVEKQEPSKRADIADKELKMQPIDGIIESYCRAVRENTRPFPKPELDFSKWFQQLPPLTIYNQDREIMLNGVRVRVWPRGHYSFEAAQNDVLEAREKYKYQSDIYERIAEDLGIPLHLAQAQCTYLSRRKFQKWTEEEDSYIIRNVANLRTNTSKPFQMEVLREVKRRCPRRTEKGILRRSKYITKLLERLKAIYDDDVVDTKESIQYTDYSPIPGLDSNKFHLAVETNHFHGSFTDFPIMLDLVLDEKECGAVTENYSIVKKYSPEEWTVWEDRIAIRERNKQKSDFVKIAEALPRRTPVGCRTRLHELKRMFNITAWMIQTNMDW